MAIGMPFENSSGKGIDSTFNENATAAGAVYVYNLVTHQQEAYIKASAPTARDNFGTSVALSADGSTLIVGAPYRDSLQDTSGNNLQNTGAAYIFKRDAQTKWTQQAYIIPSVSNNTLAEEGQFGHSVSINDTGDLVAIGMVRYTKAGDAAPSGAAFIYRQQNNSWTKEDGFTASYVREYENFADSLSLSGDGNYLAVGAPGDGSNGTSITQGNTNPANINETDNSLQNVGAAYVFRYDTSSKTWGAYTYIKASNAKANHNFGCSIDLNRDGNIMIVGACGENSTLRTVVTDKTNTDLATSTSTESGAAYIFRRDHIVTSNWTQVAVLKASNADKYDEFGYSVSINDDGTIAAVGARGESSSGAGIGSQEQFNNDRASSGAVYTFDQTGISDTTDWRQVNYIKAPFPDISDLFGSYVALNGDGSRLVVAAPGEASKASGVDGNRTDNSVYSAGAAFLY